MKKHVFAENKAITVIAEDGYYLVLKDLENSEELIGKPTRMTICDASIIPEFEEKELN